VAQYEKNAADQAGNSVVAYQEYRENLRNQFTAKFQREPMTPLEQ
jgi:hypothetical protein